MTANRFRGAPVVLLGFGGPENEQEIRPFLDRVLQGRPVPKERYEEVVRHYEIVGGKSPFNELTQRQAAALGRELRGRGIDTVVRVAYRNASPFIEDFAKEIAMDGARPIAVILAAHQSEASWDTYRESLPGAIYVKPFYDHPLFVQAHVQRVRDALQALERADFENLALVFTAHSIPQAMADRGPYVEQLHRSAQLIANAAGAARFSIAYQSRSGSPGQKWLEPDVREVLKALPQSGITEAIVSPIGFLCDHVEVLYDLDVEAAALAREHGVRMARAAALNDHPLFIRMLADLIQACSA